jgi:hypothetical protein
MACKRPGRARTVGGLREAVLAAGLGFGCIVVSDIEVSNISAIPL